MGGTRTTRRARAPAPRPRPAGSGFRDPHRKTSRGRAVLPATHRGGCERAGRASEHELVEAEGGGRTSPRDRRRGRKRWAVSDSSRARAKAGSGGGGGGREWERSTILAGGPRDGGQAVVEAAAQSLIRPNELEGLRRADDREVERATQGYMAGARPRLVVTPEGAVTRVRLSSAWCPRRSRMSCSCRSAPTIGAIPTSRSSSICAQGNGNPRPVRSMSSVAGATGAARPYRATLLPRFRRGSGRAAELRWEQRLRPVRRRLQDTPLDALLGLIADGVTRRTRSCTGACAPRPRAAREPRVDPAGSIRR